jgi:putative long chain acyl-CoA synthase
VVEFYASTEAGAILVNLRGSKPGAMGRPLPGSAEVRIAQYELKAQGLVLGRDGFARRCGVDEVGMLLVRVTPTDQLSTTPLRSLFAADDAWVVTGDLFRRDADGDYWRVDGVGDVIHTAGGPVFSTPIREALGDLDAVDLALAYGVRADGDAAELAVAAVTLRSGATLSVREVSHALSALPAEERPAVVHVVDRIPVTTWFRPRTEKLREAGIPEPGEGVQAWYLDASGEKYRPLSVAARRRLAKPGASRRNTA